MKGRGWEWRGGERKEQRMGREGEERGDGREGKERVCSFFAIGRKRKVGAMNDRLGLLYTTQQKSGAGNDKNISSELYKKINELISIKNPAL